MWKCWVSIFITAVPAAVYWIALAITSFAGGTPHELGAKPVQKFPAEHVAPHVMPAGTLSTTPLPVPTLLTVRGKLWGVKVAVTVVAAVMVTTHGPVPEQPPPLQPVKLEPVAGAAVSVTAVL